MKNLLFCAVAFISVTGLFALSPLPETKPAFKVSEASQIRPTRHVPGKGISRYKGSAMQVMCYVKGTPQFNFTKPDERFGGIALSVDGRSVKGVRRDEGKSILFDFSEVNGTLSMSLLPDGRVLFDGKFPDAKKIALEIPLSAKFFAGTTVKIDGRSITIPERTENPKTNYLPLYRGKPGKMQFCDGDPDLSFGFELSGKMQVSLGYFAKGSTASVMRLEPQSGNFDFILDPGTKAGTALAAPANRLTKVGDCDLWELDRYVLPDQRGKNLIQNSSFEQGFRYLKFHQRGRQNFAIFDNKPVFISDREAKFGAHSLAIRSTPDGLLAQRIGTHAIIMPPGTYTVSFFAKSDAPGKQTLSVQIMDPGVIWDPAKWPTVKAPLTGEWKRYTLTHQWKSAVAAPLIFSAASTVPATCYIDGVQWEAGKTATEYAPPIVEGALVTSAPDNFVEYGKPVDAQLDIVCAPGTKGNVTVKVRDFFDTVKFRKSCEFTADADGKACVKLPLDGLPRGIFIVETDYKVGNAKRYEIQRFSIMSFLDNTHKHKNMFVDTYVDPLFPTQIFRDVLERYRKVGYGARAGFVNNSQELAELAASYGVESSVCRIAHGAKNASGRSAYIAKNVEYYLVPGMNKANSMLVEMLERKGPHSPKFLKQVEDAAAEVVKNSPGVSGWYFLCEPEGTFPEWANPTYAEAERYQDFIELEAAVLRGIRRGNPAALAHTCPTSNISAPDRMIFYDRLFEEMKKRGLRYDAVSAHNYRVGAPEYPEPMEKEYQQLFDLLDKHGYSDVKISSPEGMHWLPVRSRKSAFVSDYPLLCANLNGLVPYTYDLSFAEKIHSAWRARTWLLGLKHQNRIRQMNASNYGAFEMDAMLTPFAFQKIPNTLGRLLGNAAFAEELNLFPNTRCYVFEDEKNRPVAALWCCMEEVDHGEAVAPDLFFKPMPGLQLFDLMEAEHALASDVKGFAKLPLSPYPVFLRGESGSMKEFVAMLRAGYGKSNIPVRPPLVMTIANPSEVNVTVQNPDAATLKGFLEYRAERRTLNIPANGSVKERFTLPVAISADQQIFYDLVLRLRKGNDPVLRYDRAFAGLLVKRAVSPVVVDGSPEEWQTYPAIPMKSRVRSKFLQRHGLFADDKDISADYKIAWDENGLYIAVFVTDNTYCVKERPRIKDGWKNDSLQIFLDTLANGRDNDRRRTPDSDDWSYGFFAKDPEGKAFDVYRFMTPDVQLTLGVEGAKADTLADDVKVAFSRTGNGYFYEIAFSPRSILPFRLGKGNVIGTGILLNDVDDPEASEPRSRLSNSSGTGDINGRPDHWPLMILSE